MLEGLEEECKLQIEAPVNGGRNYNGPKVAKVLVRYVLSRTKGVMIWALSQQPARRNCSTGEVAGYPRQDGKTPWSFTVV